MKKIILCILTFLMIFIFCGCGTDNNNNAEIKQTTKVEKQLNNQIIEDNDNFTLTLLDNIDYQIDGTTNYNFMYENKTDSNIGLEINRVDLNKVTSENYGFMNFECQNGGKCSDYYYFTETDLNMAEVSAGDTVTITMYYQLYNIEDYEYIGSENSFSFEMTLQ